MMKMKIIPAAFCACALTAAGVRAQNMEEAKAKSIQSMVSAQTVSARLKMPSRGAVLDVGVDDLLKSPGRYAGRLVRVSGRLEMTMDDEYRRIFFLGAEGGKSRLLVMPFVPTGARPGVYMSDLIGSRLVLTGKFFAPGWLGRPYLKVNDWRRAGGL